MTITHANPLEQIVAEQAEEIAQREEFEAWWEDFSSAHDDWKYADSSALRWAAWQAAQLAQSVPKEKS